MRLAVHMSNYVWPKWIHFARVSNYSSISHMLQSVVLRWMTNDVLSLPLLIQHLTKGALWASFTVHSACVGTEGSLNAVEVTLELSD